MRKIQFFFLTLVALLGAVTASAADVTVYIDPVGDGTWKADDAKISVNVYTDGQTNNTWVIPTTYKGNVLKVTFADTYDRMIIVRGENQDEWGWNQTENITPVDNTLYKANGYNGAQMVYTTVNPYVYKVDFNTEISTSSHDFAVAPKWKHIVQDNDGYYVNYKWNATYGANETGGLFVGKQKVGSSYYDESTVYDLLVTPKVSGTIRLKVKAYENASSSTKAFVQLWSVNGTATEKDTQLKEFQTEIPGYNTGTGDWVELTYDVTEAQRIGIRAQYVYIDDFIADAIDTTPEAALVVSSVMNSDGQTGTQGTNPVFEQQADGNMKVVLKVTLSNTGDIDFVAGTTENYTMTPAWKTNYSALTYYEDAAIDITEDIAAGESKTLDVEFTVPYTSGYKYWYIKENVTGTTSSSYRYATSAAYESKFVLRVAESGSTSDLTTAQDYGLVSSATTRSFEIYNDGTAPLTIKSITLPEGFTSDNLPVIPAGGLELAKKSATDAFNVTLPVTTTGDFSGNLEINYEKANVDGIFTKTLAFSGSVLAEGTWFADFNGDKSSSSSSAGVYPEGSVVTSSTTLQFGYTGSYGSYDHYLKPYSSAGTLVMPKLTATAGAQLKYDAVKYQSGGSYYLKVYVSTDRKTWGEPVATINNSDLETSGQRYTQTLTFDQAGDYYVAFELYGVGLDNVIGLTKTAVAHDLYFKETNLVAEAQTGKEIKPNVKVIPLTAETADGYTVKYYVDGVAVAEGTAEAMDVSATSDKTFTISYTPDDAVTTEHDTYIEFEFTDNTKIASEHQTLTVTNEPKFLFVTASTVVSQYTTNLTTAQAFGKVNVVTESKSFKIYNQGTAPLNVTSIVAPEGFSVNKTEAFTVAAGENEDIVVTFSAATPGEYAGNLVVNYTQDGAQTYELAFSGTMLDQTKWYANFDNPSSSSVIWPAGLAYESGISTSYSGYGPYNCFVYASQSTTENNKIITPLLHANAGDKFSFDVKQYGSWGSHKVYVYVSTDRKTWGDPIYTNESITNSDFETVEATITEAGNYYVGIAMTGIYVDELYGLAPVAVEHDWMIASSNIPTDAMQNVAKNASVNVVNLGLADEAADSYEVNLYINGEKTATAATIPALPMTHQLSAAGTQITVPMQSPKAGTFPVYIEVKAGEYSVATVPISVVFAEEEAVSEIATGESAGVDVTTPLNMYYKNSETIALYTQANLGLSGGEKINSITWKGYSTKSFTSSFKVYYEWTDDETISAPSATSAYAVNGMTEAINEDSHSWSKVGSSTELGDMIKIDFVEPIVYQAGKSLKILVSSSASNDAGYNTFYFEKSNTTGYAYQHQNDGTKGVFTGSWNAKNLPLIHLGLVPEEPKTYSGTVKDDSGNAIENATVTLVSTDGKNVQYSAITDENGAYSINVVQITREYDATATAYGYEDGTHNDISFADNVDHDFKLTPEASVSVTVTSAEWATITTPATYAVSFDEDTEVYIATAEEGESIKLTKINDAPAMTPIVIHATAGAYTMKQEATATSDVSANILESANGTEVGDGNGNYYVLGMNSSNVVGFGPLANGVTLAKGKAYIVPTSPSGFLTFVIGDEDETTTINAVDAAGMDDDTPVYNLAGQKVGKDYKGVVIVNGRKVVRK